MTTRLLVGILLALAAIGPVQGADDPVRKVLDAQVAAWNKKDLEGYMSGYWKAPELTFYSGGTITRGWQQTFDRYKKRYQGEGKEMGTLTFKELSIETLAPKVAVARGIWELQLSTAVQRGLFTVVFKRLPEGWKIVHDHSSME
jgi:ketosteroid isomerase-like protein